MADREKILASMVEAASACHAQKTIFLSPEYAVNQPLASYPERFACGCCATAILALRDKPAPAVLPLLPDMVDAATAAGVVVWWDNEAQEIKMAVTVQEAARVLLDAFMRKDIDPLDAVDPQIEALAIKHSGNRGDPVIQLEIAEEFFCAALRSIAASEA